MAVEPEHRSVLAVDVEAFGDPARTDLTRLRLRRYLTQAGITVDQYARNDTGDGLVIAVAPQVSTVRLLDPLIPRLTRRLVAFNHDKLPAQRLRIRVALHAGGVLADPDPLQGETVIHACRLLDSTAARACLKATDQPLVVIVSAAIYDEVVKHGYRRIVPAAWHAVLAEVKETRQPAWVHVPGDPGAPLRAKGIVLGDASVPPAYFYVRQGQLTWPHQVGVVPTEVDCFQHRGLANVLDKQAGAGKTAVLTQLVSGMGGVGKTQLAAWFARRLKQAGGADLLVWVPASSRTGIVTRYAQAGADVAGATAGEDPEQAAARFLAWLETTDRRWLVVLDDLAEATNITGLWPPQRPTGRTVVTTRRRDASLLAGRHLVDVGVFTAEEAVAYLNARLPSELADDAAGVAEDLGYLPLALGHAAAFLLDRELTCSEYRRRLADRRLHLAELFPDPAGLFDDYAWTVATTWSLSVEAASRLTPVGLARPLLELASVLDPNGIPEAVFTTPAARAYLTSHRDNTIHRHHVGEQVQVGEADARGGLRCLHRLSLITHNGGVVRVHALVQRATNERFTEEQATSVVQAAADAVLHIWPDLDRDPILTQLLRANAAALQPHQPSALWTADGGHRLLFRLTRSLGEAGLLDAAITASSDLYDQAIEHLGPDHPGTLSARSNLACWRGEAGDAAGAAVAFEELLADWLRILGPEHPNTLTARRNLAHWRGRAGDPAGAVAVLEELVADRLRVLGPEHPHTLSTRSNLVWLRGEAGDPAGAVAAAFEELLADVVRVLGPEHPNTLTARHSLAYWRGEAGDPAGAAVAFEELLVDMVRVFGPHHVDTLAIRGSVASCHGEAGDPAGAVAALEELLVHMVRVLGPKHPHTLNARHNLAYSRAEAGDAAGAEVAFQELLADRLRLLGPEHPHTPYTRRNLAYWRDKHSDSAGVSE